MILCFRVCGCNSVSAHISVSYVSLIPSAIYLASLILSKYKECA